MRVKTGKVSHKRHIAVRQASKGMQHGRRRSYKMAKQALTRALQYAYRDRRNRKRDFRRLWITRINNALTDTGLGYSAFIKALKDNDVTLDRKILSELAVNEPKVFTDIVSLVKK